MIKKLIRSPFGNALIGWTIGSIIALLMVTVRWRTVDQEKSDQFMASQNGIIMVFWHERVMAMPWLWPSAYAPDGPRGPARKSALGPVAIAQMAGKPIVPMCWSVDRYWRATGWDRLIIPKPFARGRFIIGDPIYLDDISKDQLETARQQLEDALNAQADAVDRLFTEPPQ